MIYLFSYGPVSKTAQGPRADRALPAPRPQPGPGPAFSLPAWAKSGPNAGRPILTVGLDRRFSLFLVGTKPRRPPDPINPNLISFLVWARSTLTVDEHVTQNNYQKNGQDKESILLAGGALKKKYHLVKWVKVCVPKRKGGL